MIKGKLPALVVGDKVQIGQAIYKFSKISDINSRVGGFFLHLQFLCLAEEVSEEVSEEL